MSFSAEPSLKLHLLGTTTANTSLLGRANIKKLFLVEKQSRRWSFHKAHKHYLISAQSHGFLALPSPHYFISLTLIKSNLWKVQYLILNNPEHVWWDMHAEHKGKTHYFSFFSHPSVNVAKQSSIFYKVFNLIQLLVLGLHHGKDYYTLWAIHGNLFLVINLQVSICKKLRLQAHTTLHIHTS